MCPYMQAVVYFPLLGLARISWLFQVCVCVCACVCVFVCVFVCVRALALA